ncbi:alpha/beta hydrolase [Enterococcus olivae]
MLNKKRTLLLALVGMVVIVGIIWFQFGSGDNNIQEEMASDNKTDTEGELTVNSTIGELINHSAFEDFGKLLLPRTTNIDETLSFNNIAQLMPYHSHVSPENSIVTVNRLINDSEDGEKIFYPIYSEQEIEEDPSKLDTGIFFFRGEENAPYAVIAPGGGFSYVGSLHEGFPYATELNNYGFNAFVIRYRTGSEQLATEDLAQAISFIQRNNDELKVATENYSLWGSSAGARMVARIGSDGVFNYGGENIEKPVAVVTAYTGHTMYSEDDVPTFAVVSKDDGIADAKVMSRRIENLQLNNIPAEIKIFDNVGHGFGLGVGTEAEGWIDDATSFWEKQIN